jgi:hypothetical protein
MNERKSKRLLFKSRVIIKVYILSGVCMHLTV